MPEELTSNACMASAGCGTVYAGTPALKMPAFSPAISCGKTTARRCSGRLQMTVAVSCMSNNESQMHQISRTISVLPSNSMWS